TLATSTLGQWELVTPIKTRSEFPAMQLVSDQIGYTVDRPLGAILRTDDGGATWTRLANNISSQPRALYMWDALRGIVVAGGGTVIRTTDGFATTSTSLNPTFGNITCVHFVNDTLGWIGTETGKILRSTDAGATWSLMASGQPTTNFITAIQFVDTQVGYASCYAGEMLKSTDGGLTWQGVGPFDQLVLIQDLHFYDVDLGVGVGNGGEVIRTTDGGLSWDSIPTNTTTSMLDLAVHGQTMVACGGFGRVIRSTDAGLTWTVLQAGNTDHQSVAFSPGGQALLGTDGRIHASTDTGATWQLLVEGTWHTRINKVSFMDADTGVAIGWLTSGGFESGLLRTTDGGRHWSKAGNGGLGVHLTPEGIGCLGGGNGAFARTNNGFATRTPATGPSVAIRCSWSFDANTHIVAGGAVNGGIYRTTNAGTTWTRVLDVGNITISDLWFVDELQGYAVGEFGDNYRTVDGGLTWSPMSAAGGSHTVFFFDAEHGWTRNFRTVDGGDTWTLMGGTPQSTMSIFFTSLDTGYAVSATGQTVRSTDGGATWETILPEILNASVGDAAYVDGHIVIGCNNGDIFRSERIACSSTPWLPEVSVNGQTLCTTIDGTIQWYRNLEPVEGGTEACITATTGGAYQVMVTDALGCTSAPSDPVQIVITGVEGPILALRTTIHPNPARSVFRIERTAGSPAHLELFDAQGTSVRSVALSGSTALEVGDLPAGPYLARIQDDLGVEVIRLMKE
ncbi:MAG: T9SS type A sorting domain-containing protein, partial [Flavobacteriales bacterium]